MALPSPGETSLTPTSSNARYDGVDDDALARLLDLPRVVVLDRVSSTLDVAHALAAQGAAAGTLVLADAQTSGRGRQGRSWQSESGAGVWLTILERPSDVAALDVLSLRVGIELAPSLDPLAGGPIRLKWPNDLYVGERKLAGILIEARWREQVPEWIAIGVGINVRAPSSEARAVGLRDGVSRFDVLEAAVPAIRRAARASGQLTDREVESFEARDLAVGRQCVAPVPGRVQGIDRSGALLVELASTVTAVRAGSLVFSEEQ